MLGAREEASETAKRVCAREQLTLWETPHTLTRTPVGCDTCEWDLREVLGPPGKEHRAHLRDRVSTRRAEASQSPGC